MGRFTRQAVAVPVTLVLASALAACGGGGGGSSATSTTSTSGTSMSGTASTATTAATSQPAITIKNFAYQPSGMTVKAGTIIKVSNQDSATHTVTADNQAFDTGNISGGGNKTFAAPRTPGSFPYHCTIHPFMHGTLTVTS